MQTWEYLFVLVDPRGTCIIDSSWGEQPSRPASPVENKPWGWVLCELGKEGWELTAITDLYEDTHGIFKIPKGSKTMVLKREKLPSPMIHKDEMPSHVSHQLGNVA